MSIVNAKEIMLEAAEGKYAIGAFNVTNLIQFEAVVQAAIDKKAPVIVQTSVKPSKFLNREVLVAIYRKLAESAPIPICMHLDHCTDVDLCKAAADAGVRLRPIEFPRRIATESEIGDLPGKPEHLTSAQTSKESLCPGSVAGQDNVIEEERSPAVAVAHLEHGSQDAARKRDDAQGALQAQHGLELGSASRCGGAVLRCEQNETVVFPLAVDGAELDLLAGR